MSIGRREAVGASPDPQLYNDDQINEAARTVVYRGLKKLEQMLDTPDFIPEKLDAIAQAVSAAEPNIVPEGKPDEESF